MLGFVSEELVWAVVRERGDDARKVRPHTETAPEVRAPREHNDHRALGTWVASYLRAGTAAR